MVSKKILLLGLFVLLLAFTPTNMTLAENVDISSDLSIKGTSINQTINGEVNWKADNGTSLFNNSYYLGPYANITVEWDTAPTKWNLTFIHGDYVNQSAIMRSPTNGITRQFFLQKGDNYTLIGDWDDNTTNVDFRFTKPDGIDDISCIRYQKGHLCLPDPPPTVVQNYLAPQTGYYSFQGYCEPTSINSGACNVPINLSLIVDNTKEVGSYIDLTVDKVIFPTNGIIKGNLTGLISALIDGNIVTKSIKIYMDSQPAPILNSVSVNGEAYTGTPIIVNRSITTDVIISYDIENRNPQSEHFYRELYYYDNNSETWVVASTEPYTANTKTWEIDSEDIRPGLYIIKITANDEINDASYFVKVEIVGNYIRPTYHKTSDISGFSLIIFSLAIPTMLLKKKK